MPVTGRCRCGRRTGAIRKDGFTFDIGPTFFLYPDVQWAFPRLRDVVEDLVRFRPEQ